MTTVQTAEIQQSGAWSRNPYSPSPSTYLAAHFSQTPLPHTETRKKQVTIIFKTQLLPVVWLLKVIHPPPLILLTYLIPEGQIRCRSRTVFSVLQRPKWFSSHEGSCLFPNYTHASCNPVCKRCNSNSASFLFWVKKSHVGKVFQEHVVNATQDLSTRW